MHAKFSCIISGCPEGARKWHIRCFLLCFCIAKKTHMVRLSAGNPLIGLRSRDQIYVRKAPRVSSMRLSNCVSRFCHRIGFLSSRPHRHRALQRLRSRMISFVSSSFRLSVSGSKPRLTFRFPLPVTPQTNTTRTSRPYSIQEIRPRREGGHPIHGGQKRCRRDGQGPFDRLIQLHGALSFPSGQIIPDIYIISWIPCPRKAIPPLRSGRFPVILGVSNYESQ